jgi:hypothetical protein
MIAHFFMAMDLLFAPVAFGYPADGYALPEGLVQSPNPKDPASLAAVVLWVSLSSLRRHPGMRLAGIQ